MLEDKCSPLPFTLGFTRDGMFFSDHSADSKHDQRDNEQSNRPHILYLRAFPGCVGNKYLPVRCGAIRGHEIQRTGERDEFNVRFRTVIHYQGE